MNRWGLFFYATALITACVGFFFMAIHTQGLVVYGHKGAEYLELIQLQYAIHLLDGLTPMASLWQIPNHLSLLDGEYPPLLHILTARWTQLFGDDLSGMLSINLPFLALIALALWGILRQRMASAQALILALHLLFLPAIFASARRYYYDLPLSAWVALTVATLFHQRGRPWLLPLAALFTALAALTKWQAGLYLLPFWLWTLIRGRWHRAFIGGLTVALGVGFALLYPLLKRSCHFKAGPEGGQSSLDIALGQGDRAATATVDFMAGAAFYLEGLIFSSWGPLFSALLLLPLPYLAFHSQVLRHTLLKILLLFSPIFVFFMGFIPIRDERFLLPLIPLLAALLLRAYAPIFTPKGQWRAIALLSLVLGIQMVEIDHLSWAWTHSTTALRGWNRGDEGQPSPHRFLEGEIQRRCHSTGETQQFWLEPGQAKALVHGWRWALERHCRPYALDVGPLENAPEGAVILPPAPKVSGPHPGEHTGVDQADK